MHAPLPRPRPAPPLTVGRPTAAEVWAAVQGEVTGDETRSVIASYLAPGPQPRYDTPQARAEALADGEAAHHPPRRAPAGRKPGRRDRRALGASRVLRQPGAAQEAYARWEAAHRALTEHGKPKETRRPDRGTTYGPEAATALDEQRNSQSR